MSKEVTVYFKDILDNIGKAESFVNNMQVNEFAEDDKTIYAVSRCIEIIGEAAKRIPDSTKQKYPEVPWKQITGMRDIMIHAYSSVNVNTVWRTVKEDFPLVKPIVQAILKGLDQ